MSENESSDQVFETTVKLADGWTALITADADGVTIDMDSGILDAEAATRLALAISAAAYAAQNA